MEDLAYIYLALNNEIERNQEFNEDGLPSPYSIWAPPIAASLDRDPMIDSSEMIADCDRASHPLVEQPDDTDSTFLPYQGFFYL